MQNLPRPKFRIGSLLVKEYEDKEKGYIKFIKITEMEYSNYYKCWIYYSASSDTEYYEDELRETDDYEKGTYF